MIEETLFRQQAQRFYDRIDHRYDWSEMYEGKAKMCGIESLQLEPDLRVLNIGVCTGIDQQHIEKKIQTGERVWARYFPGNAEAHIRTNHEPSAAR